jgi:hypothetical protein
MKLVFKFKNGKDNLLIYCYLSCLLQGCCYSDVSTKTNFPTFEETSLVQIERNKPRSKDSRNFGLFNDSSVSLT